MRAASIVCVCVVVLMATITAQSDAAKKQLVPTGALRAALNSGNPLTSSLGRELSTELAKRLGVEVVFRDYANPGAVTDAAGKEWDIAFVAADPDRAGAVAFTSPYVLLEATYLVPANSSLRATADADRAGIKIATGTTSAYTLVLKREIKRAELVLGSNDEGLKALQEGRVHALAGLRFNLMTSARSVPGSRVLADSFTVAQQAIAVPNGRPAAVSYLDTFLQDMKRSGFIAAAVKKTGFAGATPAP